MTKKTTTKTETPVTETHVHVEPVAPIDTRITIDQAAASLGVTVKAVKMLATRGDVTIDEDDMIDPETIKV